MDPNISSPKPVWPSSFRLFCNEKWFEHKDEILAWTGKVEDYDSTYYFQKHRWLLKRMWKDEQEAKKASGS
jgi:hypothetical protein